MNPLTGRAVISLLANNPILLLFLICGVGFTAGRISISGFSFGVAAVLFVGIGAGAVSASWILPDDVWTFGLAIFVYTTGLACGPSLPSPAPLALRVIVAGAAVTILSNLIVLTVASRLMRLSPAQTCGVIAGVSTQPAVFAYASQNTSDENSVLRGYSTVFPVVMVSKIVTAALLITLLLR